MQTALEIQPALETPTVNPLRELLGLAVPSVLQLASYTVMQLIDTWMLAKAVGPIAPAAASQAGGLSFSFISFGFGTVMVVNTLVSQKFGKKDYSHCGRYLWQGIWFGIAYGLLILPMMWVMPSSAARCWRALPDRPVMIAARKPSRCQRRIPNPSRMLNRLVSRPSSSR